MTKIITLAGSSVPVAKSGVDLVRLRALAQQTQAQHRLRGALAEIGDWTLGVKFPSLRLSEGVRAAFCFRWDGAFGSGLTLTFAVEGSGWIARAWLPVDHAAYTQLVENRILPMVTVYNGAPIRMIRLEFKESQVEDAIAHLTQSETDVHRPWGQRLEIDHTLGHLESFAISSAWDSLLRPEDQLQIGWIDVFRLKLAEMTSTRALPAGEGKTYLDELFEADEAAYQRLVCDRGLSWTREMWNTVVKRLIEVLKGRESTLDYVRSVDPWDLAAIIGDPAAEGDINPLHEWRWAIAALMHAANMNDRDTDFGRKIASFDPHTRHKEIRPLPLVGRTAEQARDFWPNTPSEFTQFGGAVIALELQPASLKALRPEIQNVCLGCSVEDARRAIQTLTDEANILNRWTIPWAARVQLAIGPFKEIQFFPFGDEISILLLTEAGEYRWAAFNLRKDAWNLEHLVRDDNKKHLGKKEDEPWMLEMEVAFQLIITAIVRDFVVVELRETVFETRRTTGPQVKGNPSTPLIVYIPKIDYKHGPATARLEERLDYASRRSHHVKPHLRKADHAKPSQVMLAERYGLKVTEGHTFVRPHQRGGIVADREVIYRSRSALQSLYGEAATVSGGVPSEWFKFERDVQGLLQAAGFTVDHVASAKNGDNGIDLLAEEHISALTWVIQCKCYSAARKIGPAVLRELLGTITLSPAGTRGMLVTTSDFTKGATDLALAQGIELRLMRIEPTGGATLIDPRTMEARS
ncbi:MAG: restriction endonuclease [Nevskia sp.]|nr:restriction endonuclease [Nevskia sp.]